MGFPFVLFALLNGSTLKPLERVKRDERSKRYVSPSFCAPHSTEWWIIGHEKWKRERADGFHCHPRTLIICKKRARTQCEQHILWIHILIYDKFQQITENMKTEAQLRSHFLCVLSCLERHRYCAAPLSPPINSPYIWFGFNIRFQGDNKFFVCERERGRPFFYVEIYFYTSFIFISGRFHCCVCPKMSVIWDKREQNEEEDDGAGKKGRSSIFSALPSEQ